MKGDMYGKAELWAARLLVFLCTAFGAPGCVVDETNLSSKRCPCSIGWTCDARANVCVRGAAPPSAVDTTDPPDAGPNAAREEAGLGGAGCRDPFDCPDAARDGGLDATLEDSGAQDAEGPGRTCGLRDFDCDDIPDDGDGSGVQGDAPCRDGVRVNCDDNCPERGNPWQDDGDNDGVGDACDQTFCRSASVLVAAGYGDQMHVSTDRGQTWVNRAPGAAANLATQPNWEDVVHGRGTWISGNTTGQTVTWARSADGATWTVHPMSGWEGVTGVQAVGYANGVWMLGSADGRLAASSDDGLSFSSIGSPKGWNGTAIESFAYHQGRLIAVGDYGQIAYSDTPRVASSYRTRRVGTGDFKQVFVAAGVWVAAGNNTCFYSKNRGGTWTDCGAPAVSYYGLHHSKGLWMLGSLAAGAQAAGGSLNDWSGRFSGAGGAWPVFGDCGSGRWFAGDRVGDLNNGLRMSENEGEDATPSRVIVGQRLPIYGIAGN